MNESEDTRLTSISKARTLDEIADFWDTHSLADYWDQTHEVEFEVRAKRRHRVTLYSPRGRIAFLTTDSYAQCLV